MSATRRGLALVAAMAVLVAGCATTAVAADARRARSSSRGDDSRAARRARRARRRRRPRRRRTRRRRRRSRRCRVPDPPPGRSVRRRADRRRSARSRSRRSASCTRSTKASGSPWSTTAPGTGPDSRDAGPARQHGVRRAPRHAHAPVPRPRPARARRPGRLPHARRRDFTYAVTGRSDRRARPTSWVIDPTRDADGHADRVPPEAQRRAAHRREGRPRRPRLPVKPAASGLA